MDRNEIGLVDYPNFLHVVQLSGARVGGTKGGLQDNFDWENDVIEKMKHWLSDQGITVEEAFKSFDRDFDGSVSREDLRWGLEHVLGIKAEEIFPTKLDRLFKLIDFYKTN
mmetsp:Transcript_22288/g.16745  ORF Transcript_22288/g.16745 Transcript_22288/m.16745 type:complete len:111 (-) Transcript_22288:141-473(-)